MFKIAVIVVFLTYVRSYDENIDLQFPDGFLIGTASSSYQVEGAWNVDDKSPSNWDNFVHTRPDKIIDGATGDVSCDQYHKYEEDVDILGDIGVDHYRFSISWSRLLPEGHSGYVSESALNYYHRLLDKLESKGIIPFVTIYHWEHPQSIEKLGGWLNEWMAVLYADYARVIFQHFGHRVKYFITLNEPAQFCTSAYANGFFPPSLLLQGVGEYQCLHNMLKGHALAYHIYDEEFRSTQNGKIGIVAQCYNDISKNQSDTTPSDISFQFDCGMQINPIFSETGDYPDIVKKMVAERSRAQGYPTSRLPTFSESWIEYIKNTSDFLGLNHYTSRLVELLPKSSILYWPNDAGLVYSSDPAWSPTQAIWLKIVPEGLGIILRKIKNAYNNPVVYITENGVADQNGTDDILRMYYLYLYMKEVLSVIKDGCNVMGYTIWSLLDSFEWNFGYTNQYGLINVDFENINRTRTFKKSASWLKTVLVTRQLQPPM